MLVIPVQWQEHLSDSVRQALERAEKASREHFRVNYVGGEHLLLGMLEDTDDPGIQLLTRMGVTHQKAMAAIEFITGRGDRLIPENTEIGLTPRAKKIFELAHMQMEKQEAEVMSLSHLLLGLVIEGESIGASVLDGMGVNLQHLRARLETQLFYTFERVLKLFTDRLVALRRTYEADQEAITALVKPLDVDDITEEQAQDVYGMADVMPNFRAEVQSVVEQTITQLFPVSDEEDDLEILRQYLDAQQDINTRRASWRARYPTVTA